MFISLALIALQQPDTVGDTLHAPSLPRDCSVYPAAVPTLWKIGMVVLVVCLARLDGDRDRPPGDDPDRDPR